MTRQVPDTRLFPQARHVCGEVGFAPYALPGSAALAERIARTFAAGPNCVVLENHGVVVGGTTLAQAFERFEALEFAAKTWIKAKQLGPVNVLDDARLAIAEGRRVELCPAVLGPPNTLEKELRSQLSEFVRRGVRQRLLISTEGSFSARLADDAFLITPSQRDRYTLTPDELVLVRGGTYAAGQIPSRASRVHRAIYRRHPATRAVVFAHPVNATAFSVTAERLDARTIPESYIFLRDVARLPYGPHYGEGAEVAERLGPTIPAALIDNDGVVVLGTSVLDAFDRLEVLESTAEALINCRHLGPLTAMTEDILAELRQAFFGEKP